MSGALLEVEDLSVGFPLARRWPWERPRMLRAVDAVSFTVGYGQVLGIVGESGSGKSTLARAVMGTLPVTGGALFWEGRRLDEVAGQGLRSRMQMIFQDPLAALDPRMTVGQIIAEPLHTHRPGLRAAQVTEMVVQIMDRVGLRPALRHRYPHEFSGGQCQRIGIARALILNPKLVVCDEPVSALDMSVQAQVINLLRELQRDLGLSLVFIAHDLAVVRHISNEIMVMYLGRVMERAPAEVLIRAPRHPYTKALIASAPIPDPVLERSRQRVVLEGELPSPLAPPSGCVFRTRCPQALPACAEHVPALMPAGPGHEVACPVVLSAR